MKGTCHLLHQDQTRGHAVAQTALLRHLAALVELAARHINGAEPTVQTQVLQKAQNVLAQG